ncbi:ubiquinol-cytochrome C chaperone [Ancylobacter dichloromethanicus]|uniref:Ubiquinol-cytochrome c chaperone n=1 Tax=Ancylobacter dichloromethanicus TaxID=518825 RepID=A0A9W6J772_9HYPH|nr:ubiquinol-cytochrome C chaperone family protein [Ancylobacter dichloromethanicus]MBS7554502.1 ubiquinol-cytochrome C chaperone [Ancylobacter dichloromethanicus]GLK71632.1 ubiquinol-cytochrome c chaperone [Ancylobacter dichloromethanicus]
MILRFFRRNGGDETIQRLYGAIVAHSRQPVFYTDYGVPDTIAGRFEMILVHAFLLFHRLKHESEARRALGQRVFDAFCTDMDANLREMGVGDLTVPKKMKKVAEAFYGRVGAYEAPLEAGDLDALGEAVLRNVYGSNEAHGLQARALADYMIGAAAALRAIPFAALAVGDFPLAPPAAPGTMETQPS